MGCSINWSSTLHFFNHSSEEGLVSQENQVERDISIFMLPNDAAKLDQNSTALEFLAYLKENHILLADSELSFPARP